MKYTEAFDLLKEGKHMSREIWDHVTAEGHSDPKFIMLVGDINFIMIVRYKPNAQFSQYVPMMEDLLADDWYVKDTSWNASESKKEIDQGVTSVN